MITAEKMLASLACVTPCGSKQKAYTNFLLKLEG